MKGIKALIAALAMLGSVLGAMVVAAPPVAAGWPGGTVYHMSPDDGFDDPWRVYCNDGTIHWLYEGQWSKNKCADVNQISVLSGNKVVCDDGGYGANRRTYWPGVHNIGDTADLRCWHQKI